MPKEDTYAVCPYYKRNDRSKICCEGICSNSTIHLAFSSPDQIKSYKQVFCRDHWVNCRIADMLNRKYTYTP